MQIQILSNNVITRMNKANKPMQELEVAYKNLTFQGKVESKKLFDFGVQAKTFQTLAKATPGDVYEIVVVKNDAGFNDWTTADLSAAGATAATSASPAASGSKPVGSSSATPAPKSTYETPEERAKKQIYIVRQSSLSNAIELLSIGVKAQPKVEHVIEVATAFEAFVFGSGSVASVTAKDVNKAGSVADMDEDIPY